MGGSAGAGSAPDPDPDLDPDQGTDCVQHPDQRDQIPQAKATTNHRHSNESGINKCTSHIIIIIIIISC